MASFLYKINCPAHEESTPSCAVYDDQSGYCFGCNTHFSKLDVKLPPKRETPSEDLDAKLAYIDTLGKQTHRGLEFPVDKEGYYIVWPNAKYYKVRLWNDTESRYKSPKGHKKPWFIIHPPQRVYSSCFVIEGEINALSLSKAISGHSVYSPGSATNFYDREARYMLPELCKYDVINIIADADIPGVKGLIELKKALNSLDKLVTIRLMSTDCNDILTSKGVEGLKHVFST
jgi:hypothetical protein